MKRRNVLRMIILAMIVICQQWIVTSAYAGNSPTSTIQTNSDSIQRDLKKQLEQGIIMYVGCPDAMVKNKKVKISSNASVTPVSYGDYGFIPLEFLCRNIGAKYTYTAKTSVINILYANKKIIMKAESNQTVVNNVKSKMVYPIIVRNSALYISTKDLSVFSKKALYYYDLIAVTDKDISKIQQGLLDHYILQIADDYSKRDAYTRMKADEIISKRIMPGMTDLEKAYQVFNYVLYDVMYQQGRNDQIAYGALIEGKSVCAGKADAVELLLKKLNIETQKIRGIYNCNHEWNLVKINSEYYHLDATMNAFLKSDQFMYKKGQTFWDWDVSRYPKCKKDSPAPQGYRFYVFGDYIYYGDFGMDSTTRNIVKAKLDGSSKSVVVPSKVSLWLWGIDGDWCYYTDGRGGVNVYKSSLSDNTKVDIPIAENLQIDDLAVVNGEIYYIDFNRTIYKLDANTGVSELFKSNPSAEKLREQGLEDLIRFLS